MKELRVEHKKNERLIFGKTNPILGDNRVLRGALAADMLMNAPAYVPPPVPLS